jgi:hypothetical protein
MKTFSTPQLQIKHANAKKKGTAEQILMDSEKEILPFFLNNVPPLSFYLFKIENLMCLQ